MPKPTTKPSVGRIVHFRAQGSSVPEAALIVAVHSDTTVNLVVWNSGGTSRVETSATWGEGEGQWDWPTRVTEIPMPARG